VSHDEYNRCPSCNNYYGTDFLVDIKIIKNFTICEVKCSYCEEKIEEYWKNTDDNKMSFVYRCTGWNGIMPYFFGGSHVL